MFEVNTDLKVKIERVQDVYWSATDSGLVTFDSSRPVEKLIFIIDNFYQNPDEVRQLTKESEVYTDKDRLAGAIGRRVWREEPELMSEMHIRCVMFLNNYVNTKIGNLSLIKIIIMKNGIQ